MQQTPFFNNAVSQGSVTTNSFSLMLATSNPELYLGGTNSKLFTGTIESHTLSSSNSFWQIGNAVISVDGSRIASGFDTIFDSDTTFIIGPPDAVKQVYSSIPNSVEEQDGFYSIPCNSASIVSFSWGGQDWKISAENFNRGQISKGSSRCFGAITTSDTQIGPNVWTLGYSFLQNVYSVFDFGTNSVGFATLA